MHRHHSYRGLILEWLRNRHHHLRHHKHHHRHVVLFVNGVGTILNQHERTKIMLELSLGHKVECTLVVLDQNGNPLLTPVAFATPPVWSNTTPATETILPSADGLTCEGTLLVVGTDVINVSATLPGGSAPVQASVAVTVDPAPQVATSIRVDAVAK